MASSINNLETATETRVKMEYQNDGQYISSISYSPTTPSADSPDSPPGHSLKSRSPFRLTRGYSWSMHDSGHQHFDIPDEYPVHVFARHGSLGSLYPLTQSHELLEPIHAPVSRPMESTPMMATDSSTSIISIASMTSQVSNSSGSSSSSSPPPSKPSAGARVRRASMNPDVSSRVFTCGVEECGRLFKRSEHLKRHVRSVHTLEKPFGCPFLACPKRFSRSDNLNQHIRIHRYDREKSNSKSFNSFAPFQGSLD
ncbi:hypothetical protein BGX26_009046 [Mortierella sp. AD094]|nr:hypothetical protein BGX26_009046 [Mortierella sp. AD094]